MIRLLRLTVVVLLSLLVAGTAQAVDGGAAGGGDGAAGGDREASSVMRDPLYIQGMDAVRAERYADAVPLLEQVVDRNPLDADACNNLGFSYRKLGDTAKAMAF